MIEEFSQKVRDTVRSIPRGKVATYGQIALYAGNHRAARQVARLLHSSSRKYNLPWHRVVNGQGKISLPPEAGGEEQRTRLKREGVEFSAAGRIDFKRYQWRYQK